MRKLAILLIALTFNSCFFNKKNGIEVKIKNVSNQPISNVEFTTSEKLNSVKFNKIEPNKSVMGFLSMKKNKTDGSYLLKFDRSNGEKQVKGGGYYTNGTSLDHWVDFIIKNDTIIVNFDAPIY